MSQQTNQYDFGDCLSLEVSQKGGSMKRALTTSVVLLAAIGSLALAQQNRTAERAAGTAGQMSGNADQEFIKDEAVGNQFEIQLAQFVQEKAQDQQVKQLTQHIIQDHQQAQQQLQQVAQSMQMQIPKELDEIHRAKLQKIQQKQGRDLETCYTFAMVGDHQREILMHQYMAQNAQNPQVKQYAQQTLQPLEQHERLAWQAAEVFVPQARTASERMRGSGANNTTGTSGDSTGRSSK